MTRASVLLLIVGCGAPPAPVRPVSLFETTLLSETGLYQDIESKEITDALFAYEPTFRLWSDGAKKDRWLSFPEGSEVEPWTFPIGTRLFKEFALDGRRIETRVISREGADEWFFGSFLWRADESDAELVVEGANDVDGHGYDVPSSGTCLVCHQGSPTRVLGYSALQNLEVEADPITTGLGYLHANCGHCHGEGGYAARAGIDMILRLDLVDGAIDPTRVLESTINRPTAAGAPRIVPGHPEQSAIIDRMTRRDDTRMPPLGTHVIDEQGVLQVSRMIEALR